MKKLILFLSITIFAGNLMAQQTEGTDITKKNSWLKAGLNAGVPFGNLGDVSSFTLGLDLKGQLMETNHLGIGLTTGYNHFFAKDDFESFGTIPLGAFVRYYPQSQGFFIGTDLGYSFLTGLDDADGGFYIRPQVGYHNYDWNFFAFYNGILRSDDNGGSLHYAGIGATYNIRFK
ncbi:MAG TPA: hypothetical protein VJ647_06290 [Chitinophagaceae bacterium]|nr:hypothetical protein [Chitinophagaceae bacterium]